MTYALETIGSAVATFVGPDTSYRSVALGLAGENRPPDFGLKGCGLSTMWGGGALTSPSPSTVFRWVARFAAGSADWWPRIVAKAQERVEHALTLPRKPSHLAGKARIPGKHQQLATTWILLWVLFLLTGIRGEPINAWPLILLRVEKRPLDLDPTGWFVSPCRAPP